MLLPFLASRGVTKLDMLMISHGDQDHSGGYETVVNRFPVHRLLGFRGDPCRHGERWRWGVAELLVINGPGSGESDRNDGSCALLVSWRDHAVLLTGDVSRAREREWVRYWRDTLQASVLLLPHHGSQTSTSHALLKWFALNGPSSAEVGEIRFDIPMMRLSTGWPRPSLPRCWIRRSMWRLS